MKIRYENLTPGENRLNRHLIAVVHGSRLKESELELKQILSQVKFQPAYSELRYGFLEIQSPSIPEAIENSFREGANEVYVLPLFILGGRHVLKDVPAEVDKAREKYPNAKIEILPYIGTTSAFGNAIQQAASQTPSGSSQEKTN